MSLIYKSIMHLTCLVNKSWCI